MNTLKKIMLEDWIREKEQEILEAFWRKEISFFEQLNALQNLTTYRLIAMRALAVESQTKKAA